MTFSPYPAHADEPGEQTIKKRIEGFREIGTAYKHINDELKSAQPSLPKVQESAQLIKSRGGEIVGWFPPDSKPPAAEAKSWLDTVIGWFFKDDSFALPDEIRSHAKPAIWLQSKQFQDTRLKFQTEAERLATVSQGGSPVIIAAQLRKLGETCKSCHDTFREKVD